jgi:ankyrin repeat protein
MTHQNLVLSEKAIKAHSKRLQKQFKNYNQELSLSESQNLFSKTLGFNKSNLSKHEQLTEKEKSFLEPKYLQLFLLSIDGNLDKFKEYLNNHTELDLNFIIKDRSWEPKSAIEFALKSNNLEIVNYLIDNKSLNINLNISNNYLLKHSCYDGHLDLVKKLIKLTNFDYHSLNYSFQISAQSGYLDIVRFLALNVSINIHFNGDSALKFACQCGRLDVVKYLLTSNELKENSDIFAEDSIEYPDSLKPFRIKKDIRDMFISEIGSRPEHLNGDGENRKKLFEVFDFLINDYKNPQVKEWFKQKHELKRYIYE